MKTPRSKFCPLCGADTFVVDSRVNHSGDVQRTRRCQRCGFKYVTAEKTIYGVPGDEKQREEYNKLYD